jgi:hypothetical protein
MALPNPERMARHRDIKLNSGILFNNDTDLTNSALNIKPKSYETSSTYILDNHNDNHDIFM